MEEVARHAETSLSKFSYALDQLEQTIRPVLKAIDELRASGNEDDLDAMSRARMHISLSYAVNALFCMYLRTQGVDPATHPVSEDIGRVQDAFMRMRKVEAGFSIDHQPVPDRDRRRHIVNAKKSTQKLATLVFPEEVDLLNAIRGKKRKREVIEQGKGKKIKTREKTSLSAKGTGLDSSDSEKDITGRESLQNEEAALQSRGASARTLEGTGEPDKIIKNRSTSGLHSTTESSSEDGDPRPHETQETHSRETVVSPEEDVSGKKKKKKKAMKKSSNEDSNVDSKRIKSKDKKDKKDRTEKESERSEEKRKRKKNREKKRKSRHEQ